MAEGPVPVDAAEAAPVRYVPPRTGLRQSHTGAMALAGVGGAVASIAAAFAVPITPFGVRDLRMPVYGGVLVVAIAGVAFLAARQGRWWLAPLFAAGMLPFGALVWLFDGWRC